MIWILGRILQESSAKALEEYVNRDLSEETYVVLMLDGIQFRGHQVVVCVGGTEDGESSSKTTRLVT